jgi:hypothetical protein
MKHALLLTLCLLGSTPTAAIQGLTVERVGWLQGCWQSAAPPRIVEEQWMAPRAKSMIGMGRTVRGERLVEYESMLIREQGGQLAYEAHPSGQPGAVFLARTATDAEVVFENLKHDFPQRVGYRRKGRDVLVGWIEGTSNGQPRRVEFPYRRVGCPGT